MGSARRISSVVFLTFHSPPEIGGIQTRISKYVEKLTAKGIQVTVLVAGSSPVDAVPWRGVKVIACGGGLVRLPGNIATLLRSVFRARPDVVHVFTGSSTLLGASALVIGRMSKARPVISIFGREDLSFSNFVSRAAFRFSTSIAYAVDVNSAATRSLLPPHLRWKVRVLLGGAEEPSNPVEARVPNVWPILFVGRLAARKGVDDLLRAFAIARESHPEAMLVIVGDGPEKQALVRLAHRLGVGDSAKFKGTLVGKDLELEYAMSSVVVLPSKDVLGDSANEGLGLALIEAAMQGKPLIGTRHGGIPEVVKDGINGLLVPPGDPQALAIAISTMMEDAVLTARMGEASLRMAKSKFGWDQATDRLLESYQWRETRSASDHGAVSSESHPELQVTSR